MPTVKKSEKGSKAWCPTRSFPRDAHPKPLPEEIITEIVFLCTWADQIIQPSTSDLIRPSHVSRAWRNATLHKTCLWSYIDSKFGLSQIKAFLARSGNRALTILVGRMESRGFWRVVCSVSHRWKTLRFFPAEQEYTCEEKLYYSKIHQRFTLDLRVGIVPFHYKSLKPHVLPFFIDALSALCRCRHLPFDNRIRETSVQCACPYRPEVIHPGGFRPSHTVAHYDQSSQGARNALWSSSISSGGVSSRYNAGHLALLRLFDGGKDFHTGVFLNLQYLFIDWGLFWRISRKLPGARYTIPQCPNPYFERLFWKFPLRCLPQYLLSRYPR